MSSAQLSRLTDALWLTAHDGVDGRACVGGRPLAVGLAAGLLAELVHARFVELREGELFRTTDALPDDPALSPVLATMATEERDWARPVPAARARVRAGEQWPGSAPVGLDWPPLARDGQGRPGPLPVQNRHRMRGHDLGVWMSYLAYEQRAENLVIDRLERAGLVKRQEQLRLFRGPMLRYVPCDSAVSGNPANGITTAIQRGYDLNGRELVLAGLFLATGLHQHALATLTAHERSVLADQLGQGLDPMSRQLLNAADAAIGEAAMR